MMDEGIVPPSNTLIGQGESVARGPLTRRREKSSWSCDVGPELLRTEIGRMTYGRRAFLLAQTDEANRPIDMCRPRSHSSRLMI